MGRLPGQVGDVLTLLGHVMQYQHRPRDLAGAADRCAHQSHGDRAAIQALDGFGMLAAATELALDDVFNKRKAVGLGIVIQQVEQRRQGQPMGLGRIPMSQRLGRRVHVSDGAVDIGGDHPIANRLQRDLRSLLLLLQGVGKRVTLGQQLMGTQQRQYDQAQSRGQVGGEQQPQDHPRAFAQGITERLGRRCHAFVDGGDMGFPLAHVVGAHLVAGDRAVHLTGEVIQLHQVAIADCP